MFNSSILIMKIFYNFIENFFILELRGLEDFNNRTVMNYWDIYWTVWKWKK